MQGSAPDQVKVPDLRPSLFPKQVEFYNAVVTNRRARKFILGGGAQSGKTRASSWLAVGKIGEKMNRTVAKEEEPGTAWLVAPTYKLLGKLKREFLAKLPTGWIAHQNDEEVVMVTGDRVQFRSAKNPQDLRGEDCFLVVFDELSRAHEDAFLNCQTRLAVHDGVFISSTTPCNAESPWLTEEYFAHLEDPEYSWSHCAIEDNLKMPAARIAELRKRFPDEYGIEELDGHFLRSREGLVYKNFDGRVHIVEDYEPTQEDEVVAGCDSGVNHPFVYLRIAIHPSGGATVFSEIYESGLSAAQQVALVKNDPMEKRVLRRWVDPSALGLRVEFHNQGLQTRKADNNVFEGIRCVYSMLAPRDPVSFRVTRSCRGLIREFGLYRYKKATTSHASDIPFKICDDAADSLRYALFSEKPGLAGQVSAVTTAEKLARARMTPRRPSITVKEGQVVLCGSAPPIPALRAASEWDRTTRPWFN